MHISEGILNVPTLAGAGVLSLAAVGLGVRRMSVESTPKTALLAAVFFVGSLIHVPFGPSSVHLLLNGLAGILLGWTVFPALAVALALQALLFQFGGLTVLGVNVLIMATPALLVHYAFRTLASHTSRPVGLAAASAFLGAAAVALSGLLLTGALMVGGGRAFLPVAAGILLAHVPVMVADGLVTAAAVWFLRTVRPDLLPISARPRQA